MFLGKPSMYGNIDQVNGYELEPTLYWFDKFLRIFPKEPFTYIFGIAVMFCTPLIVMVKKTSSCPPLSILLLLTIANTSIYLFFFLAHRQMLATVFFIWAYLAWLYLKGWWRVVLTAACLYVAVISHSSSYFVIAIALAIYFIKTPSKRVLYAIVVSALLIGLFAEMAVKDYMTGLMTALDSFKEVSRSTYYLVNDEFADQEKHLFTKLPPMALAIIVFIRNYTTEELNKYSVKCWIVAFVLFMGLSTIPLIDRSLELFWLIGLCGAIPERITSRRTRQQFVWLSIMFLYLAFRAYSRFNFLLPYNFLLE